MRSMLSGVLSRGHRAPKDGYLLVSVLPGHLPLASPKCLHDWGSLTRTGVDSR